MRIISTFHDYYDGAHAGIDTSIIYQRKTEFLDAKDPALSALIPDVRSLSRGDYRVGYRREADLTPFSILFCGRLYAGAHFKDPQHDLYFFDVAALQEFVDTTISHLGFKLAKAELWERPGKTFRQFLSVQGTPLVLPAAETNRWPVLMYAPSVYGKETPLVKDPCLKDFGFFRLVDPYTAYQDIAQYLARLAAPENQPPVHISDVDMANAKGFDKHSFRKLPTKRR